MKTKIALLVTALVMPCCALGAVHRVEKAGAAGVFTTITAAIQASGAGDIIQIGPGVFAENVRVPWSLTFVGTGPQFTTIRGSTAEAAIQGEAGIVKSTVIQGVTISNPIGDGVNPAGYDLRIENSVIANCGRYGVWLHAGGASTAALVIRQCTLALNFSYAIHSPAGGSAAVVAAEGTIFYRNNESGASQENVTVGTRIASGCMTVGKPLLNLLNVNSFSAADANFLDAGAGNFILQAPSPAINGGKAPAGFLDPDGSIPDIGAYGGLGAASFWPYPVGGPVISSLQVTPIVQQGGRVEVKATATTR